MLQTSQYLDCPGDCSLPVLFFEKTHAWVCHFSCCIDHLLGCAGKSVLSVQQGHVHSSPASWHMYLGTRQGTNHSGSQPGWHIKSLACRRAWTTETSQKITLEKTQTGVCVDLTHGQDHHGYQDTWTCWKVLQEIQFRRWGRRVRSELGGLFKLAGRDPRNLDLTPWSESRARGHHLGLRGELRSEAEIQMPLGAI